MSGRRLATLGVVVLAGVGLIAASVAGSGRGIILTAVGIDAWARVASD